MPVLWVEIRGPEGYTLERWKIPVKKTWNIPPDRIIIVESHKKVIKFLKVGREVDEKKVREYFIEYLREKGLFERVIRMQLLTI
jgi:hypothetical protein